MTDYLNTKEKVVVANSKVESVNKELIEALRVEKALVVQKDEEIQAALLKTDVEREKIIQKIKQLDEFLYLQFIQYFKGFELLCRWTMKHHSLVVDFSNLDFKKIDTEVLADKAKEQEETKTSAAMEKDLIGKDVVEGKDTDEHVVPLLWYIHSPFFFFFLENNGGPFVLGFYL